MRHYHALQKKTISVLNTKYLARVSLGSTWATTKTQQKLG